VSVSCTIRKVVIPAAGLGIRLLPATKAVPKEMMPIAARPLIQFAVEEAAASGLDGVVASPLEVVSVRAAVTKEDFLVVTPGVRPAGAASHDQRRLATPAAAIRAGSDYLVIGRPIIDADDPVAAANSIVAEIEDGLRADQGIAPRSAEQTSG